ncbi:50S ribosomal protein L11 methyltransferase [Leptobacterium sp. I13]|uniref:50S ribosomal protein L11 methyltransferase n=1 Tax=Leptobacterium meishanense TaxID=3128904 RepID=UPI0030EEA071
MSQTYVEYTFKVSPLQPASDILIAELGAVGFESFVENESGILAYVQKEVWKEGILKAITILKNPAFQIQYNYKEIEPTNWNAEWEQNFHPIEVDGICIIRAPFHKTPKTRYDIVIEPKMSFGTGHHETTHMMIQHLLQTDMNNKRVLDMGCGTGVLAILAAKKGAVQIDAIDIDNWCYLNSLENIARNQCGYINIYEGDASILKNKKYDIIIANINRNILLQDIPVYVKNLDKEGILFLSGFYEEDISVISEKCKQHGLMLQDKIKKNSWVALKYVN